MAKLTLEELLERLGEILTEKADALENLRVEYENASDFKEAAAAALDAASEELDEIQTEILDLANSV